MGPDLPTGDFGTLASVNTICSDGPMLSQGTRRAGASRYTMGTGASQHLRKQVVE